MEDTNTIKYNVAKIRDLVKNNQGINEEELDIIVQKDYHSFIEQYPTIYKKIKDNTLDEDKFTYMLDMLSKVNNKEMTEFNASVDIGQKLVDHYVKPNLNK